MIIKSSAIDRLLRENPQLAERRYGLPDVGLRDDGDDFNPTVKSIADAINFYGYEVRDENITTVKDIDLGGGNPTNFRPFPLAIEAMKNSLDSGEMYKYPYTEGDDRIRKQLLDYVEDIGFINNEAYSYSDIDDKGLSVNNITFLPSTSIAFNLIVSIISKPGDVILVTGPNYGLFVIRAERAGAEVEILNLEREDNYLVNPKKLADKIDDINKSLETVYNRRKGYVPRVVAFLNANPNNPTGKVMGEKDVELLKEIGEVCAKRGVFVIDDLVYRDICYDKDNLAKPIATIPGMFRNTISLFGLSKSYGMASLRAGFVVADEVIIRELVNRIFQGWDSSPDITGWALAGAFNATERRKEEYDKYFDELRSLYVYKYNLLKALVRGIDSIKDINLKEKIEKEISNVIPNEELPLVLEGLPYVDFPENLETESGFFAILDFTKVKGMRYHGEMINTEKGLLRFFYKTARLRFLVGQSISWPYKDELVGRVSFAYDNDYLISSISKMNKSLRLLEEASEFSIRYNELKDQEQMARIKIEGWQTTYDKIISSRYLNSLDLKKQTERYIASFNDYKDLVLVAVDKDDHVLGYSCFAKKSKAYKYDSELVSLYIKPGIHNKGLGTALFKETMKVLYEDHKYNMIVWCLKENTNALSFYKEMGGTIVEEKVCKIGDDYYEEYGFYFDLECN